MSHRSEHVWPIRSMSASEILNSKLRDAKTNTEVVDEILTQWKDPDFDIKSMFLSIQRNNGDVNALARCAQEMREAYLEKAASLYRSVDTAIDSMERTVASMVYAHPELSDEELKDLEAWNIEGLTVELGVDEHDEPVLFDFAKTSHLYGVHGKRGYGFNLLTNSIVEQLPRAKFVFLGSACRTSCALAVPPAESRADIDACMEWLKAEQDQRVRLMDLYNCVSYPLFLFVKPQDENWLYDVDGLADLADGCGYFNMHLVVYSDTSFLSLLKRAEDPTLLTLMSYTQDDYGVILDEGSRQNLYRLLTLKQFDTWLERLGNLDEHLPNDYWGLPIYKDLGISFVDKGRSYREVLDLDETYRNQEHKSLSFSRRM